MKMEFPKQELHSNYPCRCKDRELKKKNYLKEESWLINRHVSRDIEKNNEAEKLNADNTKSQFDYAEHTKNDFAIFYKDLILEKSEVKPNVQSGMRNNIMTAPTTVMKHKLSKNEIKDKEAIMSRSFKRNIPNDGKGNITETEPIGVLKRQPDDKFNRNEVTIIQKKKNMKNIPQQLKSEGIDYQETNIKIIKSLNAPHKFEENFVVQNKGQEKNIHDNQLNKKRKPEYAQKSETNYFKTNEIDKTNTILETHVKKQEKNNREDIPLEIKSKGVINQKNNESKIKGDKTTTDNLDENRYIKQEKNITNNLHQNLNSKKAGNLERNIQIITKKYMNSKNELEENAEISKTKPEKTVKQEQFQDSKSKGGKCTVINESKINEKYNSNSNKFDEKVVLRKNEIRHKEKSHPDGAKHLQSKLGKDLIISSLPKHAKISAEPKRPNPQKVLVNEKNFKLDFEFKHSPNRNHGKGKSINNIEGKVAWENDIKERKQQKRSDSQKSGADAHEYLQSIRNKMGIQRENVGLNQLLFKDLQPVDHLRGGGPKLFEHSKIKNEVIDKNMNKVTELTEKSKDNNVKEEPKNLFKGNKNYLQQQQKNEQVQILKDILHQAKSFTIKSKDRYQKLNKIETLPIVSEHASHKFIVPSCVICQDSELNLDLESFKNPKTFEFEECEYVKNSKICTSRSKPLTEEPSLKTNKPLFFKAAYDTNQDPTEIVDDEESDTENLNRGGVIQYALSNREFIERGWTILPVETIIRTLNVYRMRPAYTEFNWFEHNKSDDYITYKTGEKLADFDKNGHGRWYYRNGQVALDYYESEDINSEQRIVIYSKDGEVDQSGRSHPLRVLAIFDYTGNGIVFDHNGKTRLKYNQLEGLVLDRDIGPISHWKWNSLNDSPNLQRVIINTALEPKDENIMRLRVDDEKIRQTNQDVIEIELHNVVKEHQKAGKLVCELFKIKMKALKINEQFSLRIMDQEKIHITFKDGPTHLKLNIGMVIDNSEVISVHTENLGEILNSVEKKPADTTSLEKLQSYIEAARQSEHMRMERLQRSC